MPSIGIDFGTTNSLMVSYDRRLNEFNYYSFEGDRPVPISSTVWYNGDKILIGSEAREKIYKYCDIPGNHFEKSIKLKLGTDYSANIFGKKTTPDMVASEIIKNMIHEAKDVWLAEKSGVDLRRGVFTIPINFSGKARKDLRKAANAAGIDISTFIHEPFAAIIGYFFTRDNNVYDKVINELLELDKKYILTFDWGGGTLDITIVKIENGKMQEVGNSELTGLAGDKFDEQIALWAWNKYLERIEKDKYTKDYLESIRKKKWGRLISIAESCKIILSTEESTNFLLESVIPSEDIGIDEIIDRKIFASLINNIIDKSCSKIDEAIKQANISDINIDEVLLTGGSCCIPAIQDRLKEKFGHRVETIENADLVIAQGAAVIAEFGWLPFLTKDIQIELSNNFLWALFEKGMPIPSDKETKKTETFTCVDGREKIAKIIVSDGSEQNRDSILAIINVPVLGDKRFGDDVVVEACIDKDIVLCIKAYSKMVVGYEPNQEYSVEKIASIYKMCFGLEIG